MTSALLRTSQILGVAAMLGACGGLLQVAGIEGTGDSNGSATGYGSLFVNGTQFDTAAAEFLLDGAPVSETGIAIGMRVHVDGNIGDALASRVSATRSLRGPIDAVERVGMTQTAVLTVLGQPVLVDEMTRWVGTTLEQIDTDSLVDVHAFSRPGGVWLATYIELADADYVAGSTVLDVTGSVDRTDDSTLELAGLTVDTANTTANGAVTDGDRVRVRGLQTERGGDLIAQQIETVSQSLAAGREIQREGLIAGLDEAIVQIDGVTVDLADAQRLDATDRPLALGNRVIVRGTTGADGVLQAADVRLIPAASTVLQARVETGGSNAPILVNTAVRTLPVTQYVETRPGESPRFRATDLRSDESVRVTGYRDGDNRFVAARIERIAVQPDDALRGVVDDSQGGLESGTLVIDGFTARTDGSTVFVSVGGTTITGTAFYTNIESGARVQTRGTFDPATGVLSADVVRQLSTADDESEAGGPADRGGDLSPLTPDVP